MELTLTEDQIRDAFHRMTELYTQAQANVDNTKEGDRPARLEVNPIDFIIFMDYGSMWEKRLSYLYGFMETLEENISLLRKTLNGVSLPEKPKDEGGA